MLTETWKMQQSMIVLLMGSRQLYLRCAFANFLFIFNLMFNIFSFEQSYILLCHHLNVARSGLLKSNIQSRTLPMKINPVHLCYFWMSKHDGPQHRKWFVSKIDLSSDYYFFLRFFFALGCALDNRKWIDNFVLQYNYLQPFELSDDDWNMVAQGSSLVIE